MCDVDVGLRDAPRVLVNGVKQDEQVLRPAVQDAVQVAPVMAPELAEFTVHLR